LKPRNHSFIFLITPRHFSLQEIVMDANALIARLGLPRSEFARVRERISYWCKTECFVMGGMRVGRGRSRDFNPRCILEAALFNELANFGFPVAAYGLTSASLHVVKAAEAWATGDQQPRWLQLSVTSMPTRQMSGQITPIPHIGELKPFWVPGTIIMMIVDVSALLQRVQWSSKDEETAAQEDQERDAAMQRVVDKPTRVRRGK
jgi:hypothetical protein